MNDKPHIGHAYTCVVADTLARWRRLKGDDVFFLTGTDEHGEKVASEAKKRNIKPLELADEMVIHFKNLWQFFSISYNDFIRTTEDRHIRVVQRFFQNLMNSGDIYKGKYSGWYCVPCESFWTQIQLEEGKCPQCNREVHKLEEDGYFFRMSKYQNALLMYYDEHPEFIMPLSRRDEVINFVKDGLKDLCITRRKLSWGISLADEPGLSIYVWFDALLNYISAIGYIKDEKRFKYLWPADIHFVGKDILKFHTVIWPSLLLAAGLPLPGRVFAHGWWMMNDRKMSKSFGNIVDPNSLIEKYGADALRYFLLREIPLGSDGYFSISALEKRFNADLANDLGNLLNRTISMVEQYFQGVVPESREQREIDTIIVQEGQEVCEKVDRFMQNLEFSFALEAIWQFINCANKYIEDAQPWRLKKENSFALNTVMYTLMETLRIIAIFIFPFMPCKAEEMWSQIGMNGKIEGKRISDLKRGLVRPGTKICKGNPLFPRIE